MIMADMMVEIEGSGKHCHVTRETLDILYGEGFELEIKKMLTQPGQFVSPQKLTLHGPRGTADLSIVGPCRKVNQIELSFTDARALGFDPPIRDSGDVAGSSPCTIVGPKGSVELEEGVIIVKRHVHVSPADAEKFGVKDKQIVKLKTDGVRALVFDEVVVRSGPDHATYAHLDYDEINAGAIFGNQPMGEIIK